jgi:hypothetical protein
MRPLLRIDTTSNVICLFSLLLLAPLTHTMPVAATTTSSEQSASPTATAATPSSLVDGYCSWSDERRHRGWYCKRKGFLCEGIKDKQDHNDDSGVCVDRRTPEQKEADKQDAADGRDGRCSFRFEDGYFCKQKGFVCVDGRTCEDGRTEDERLEDNRLETVKKAKRESNMFAGVVLAIPCLAILVTFVGLCASWLGGGKGDMVAKKKKDEERVGQREERQREEVELLDRASGAANLEDSFERVVADEIPATDLDVKDDESLPEYVEPRSENTVSKRLLSDTLGDLLLRNGGRPVGAQEIYPTFRV